MLSHGSTSVTMRFTPLKRAPHGEEAEGRLEP